MFGNIFLDSTRKSGRRLVGDVDFEEAKLKASFITPVPGGKIICYRCLYFYISYKIASEL